MFECRSIRKRLIDYIEGAEAPNVERHVGICDACRRELEALQSAKAVVLAVRQQPAPERVWGRIQTAIRDIEGETSHVWRLLTRKPAYGVAAGMLLLVLMGYSLSLGPSNSAWPIMMWQVSPIGISVEAGK